MWEDETIVLVTSLKKRILGGKDSVRFSQISSDKGIPAYIKAKFKERVERYIVEESPLSLKSTPHFELKPEDLKNLRTRFLDVLRQAARFPKQEIESILRDALILRIDYLVKPVDTIRRVLFKDSDSVQYSFVESKLILFLEVLSYAEYVLKESSLRRPEKFSGEEYTKIISELLNSINQKNPLETVLSDFSILLNFLSETKSEQITRVEAGMVQDFLADRNLIGFRRAVDVEVELGKKDFSSQDLELTIKRYIALKSEFGEQPEKKSKPAVEKKEEPTQEQTTKEADIEEIDQDWIFDDISIGDGEPEPKNVKTDEPAVLENTENQKPEKTEPNEQASAKPMRIIRRDIKEEEKEDKEKSEKIGTNSIKSYIDKKAEKNFVKKLFSGDQNAFSKLIQKLDEAESWRVAKILIDNELFKRDVDPFSREAIKLVDLVYSLYYPEEGIGGTK